MDALTNSIGEAPLMVGAKQIAESLRAPGSTASKLGGGILGGAVPSFVNALGQVFDPNQREAQTLGAR